MIKCIFIDIDGTLVNSNRKVTDRTKKAIKECMDRGIKVVLASGRSRKDTLEYIKELNTTPYIISSNGADVYDIEKEKQIYINPIDNKLLFKLFEYTLENNYKIAFNYNSDLVINMSYYPDEKDKERTKDELIEIINNEKIVQCIISNRDIEKMLEFKNYFKKELLELNIANESKRLNNLNLKPSSHYYCDITNKNISKGEAIKKLCEYLNIEKKEIISIGDGENDISMFEQAHISVAMGNAVNELKEKANYITDTNDEEGVAKFLEEFLEK